MGEDTQIIGLECLDRPEYTRPNNTFAGIGTDADTDVSISALLPPLPPPRHRVRILDATSESPKAKRIRSVLESRVTGQTDAVNALVGLTDRFHSGLFDRTKPIGSILLLGPTGSGKTRLSEAMAEALFDNPRQCLKIDCGEFQHSSDIAKLLGSPPGYTGHRDTKPVFTNEKITALYGDVYTLAVLVFDEIEKASDALWNLLLGMLDKGHITNGYNEEVDLTRTIILLTSNVGAVEMTAALNGGVGFRAALTHLLAEADLVPDVDSAAETAALNKRISEIGLNAAKRKFSPEFVNRMDSIVACHALTKVQSRIVVDMELDLLQEHILKRTDAVAHFFVSDAAKAKILEEGFDPKYNARNVKRVIDKHIRLPLSRILASHQWKVNESIHIDLDSTGNFTFTAIKPLCNLT